MSTARVKVSRVKIFLGKPTWYVWHKCITELGLPSNLRYLDISQTKLVLGWFALYNSHSKIRTNNACLAAYYAYGLDRSDFLCPSMSGKEILDLPNRPCLSTLYRRGFSKKKIYTPEEVQRLLLRSK